MEVLTHCQAWKRMMESGGEETRRVLANIEADPCVDEDIEKAFFERLAARGDPRSPGEAWNHACATVREGADYFVCQGREVPGNIFVTLFRFQMVSSLRYTVPQDVLDAKGLRDRDLIDVTAEEDLRVVTDEYGGSIRLGNDLEVVWTTDFALIENALDDLPGLMNRLGIATDRYVLCAYNRNETGLTLHVPRALDAANHPRFEVGLDCAADYGTTVPLEGTRDQGLPEAVHRSCWVTPTRWELGRVE